MVVKNTSTKSSPKSVFSTASSKNITAEASHPVRSVLPTANKNMSKPDSNKSELENHENDTVGPAGKDKLQGILKNNPSVSETGETELVIDQNEPIIPEVKIERTDASKIPQSRLGVRIQRLSQSLAQAKAKNDRVELLKVNDALQARINILLHHYKESQIGLEDCEQEVKEAKADLNEAKKELRCSSETSPHRKVFEEAVHCAMNEVQESIEEVEIARGDMRATEAELNFVREMLVDATAAIDQSEKDGDNANVTGTEKHSLFHDALSAAKKGLTEEGQNQEAN
jgi:uncharacterized protein (DUF305 family)